jgi:hypothetical protein
MEPDLPVLRPAPLAVDYHRHGWVTSLRHTIANHVGTGISTRCPSTTPVGLALGPDSPGAD